MRKPLVRKRPHTPIGLTRRAAVMGIGAAGAAALVASARLTPARAQDASPIAADLEAYPELQIIARDFSFELPAEAPGGMTRVTLINEGEHDHHAILVLLNDEVTSAEVEAALAQPDFFQVLDLGQALGGPNGPAPGGGTATVILDLVPGTYQVVCVVPEEDGTPHYMRGMHAPLTVTESDSALAAPEASLTVELVDFDFNHLPAEVPAGAQVWAVTDVGEEPHELALFKLAPGVPFDVVLGIFGAPAPGMADATPAADGHMMHEELPADASPMAASPAAMGPPFTSVPSVAPMGPGMTNWLAVELEPGEYFAICFVPSPANGMAPHFALGMIMPFTAV